LVYATLCEDVIVRDGAVQYRAFVAFSGGGAKGIVHVGALKALEQRKVDLLGLSGTSAGSIVAALVAAGFRADDLIDGTSGRTILDQLNTIDSKLKRATDLFDGEWHRVRLLRAAFAFPISLGWLALLVWLVLPMLGWFLHTVLPSSGLVILSGGWLVLGYALFQSYRIALGGLAKVQRFRDALDVLLQRKMFPDQPGRTVLLGDFGKNGFPTLKIVSANISRHSLHLFSPERTPEMPVADAVAASICLPLVFSPWSINEEMHVDGGIVSNLPAWTFDEERELDPEALTIAVEVEVQPESRRLSRFNWAAAAVRTGLFGSGELNLRVSGPTEKLALPTRFGLLDFDKSAAVAAAEVNEVATAAGVRLDKRLFRLPEVYRNACQVAQALAQDELGIAPGGGQHQRRIRVAIGRLDRGYRHSLRLSYSVGFEDDADEAALVPIEGSVAGAAWQARQSRLEVVPFPPELDLPGRENRLRRKLRWSGLAWTMCIPILYNETGSPRLLVQLDGNWCLDRTSATADAFGVVEGAVKDFFGRVLDELELEGDA